MTGIRNIGFALSLANLILYPVWAEVLPGSYGHYFLKGPPGLNIQLGMLLVVLLFAAVLSLGVLLVRPAAHPTLRLLGKAAFLVVCLLAFNGVRVHLLRFSTVYQIPLFTKIDEFLIRPGLLLCALLLLTKWRHWVLWAAKGLVLALIPFVVVTFSQVAWASVKLKADIPFEEFADQPTVPLLPTKEGMPRVVWLLFDELEQRLTFDERRSGVNLPNLDRLRQQAVYATSAYPPAARTLESIPALLMGKMIAYARPVGVNDLWVQFDNTGQVGSWGAQPSVFTKARELGCNTALLGYAHPYGRILGHHVTKCFWMTSRWSLINDDPRVTVPEAMSRILRTEATRMLASLPFFWRLGFHPSFEEPTGHNVTGSIPERIEKYQRMLDEAKAVVGDPAFQLVFIHWLLPHHPYIYDRRTDDFSWDSETSYSDNLELVDRTLGEIRDRLEASALWDATTIIISSDHASDPHYDKIPFLLKLPGQKEAIRYEQRLNTVVISELLLGILSGQLSDSRQIVSWMEQNSPPVSI